MNSYDLSRHFWNWAFDNPEKISPNHCAVYFFAVEHCNRLGWKLKFGFPSQMTMDAIGIKKHSTYIRYFNDLVEFGFFELIQKSKNQYSSNIISLTSALPEKGVAMDKAIVKHTAKQTESNGQSKRSIDKPINKETTNKETYKKEILKDTYYLEQLAMSKKISVVKVKEMLDRFHLGFTKESYVKLDKYKFHWFNWYNKNNPVYNSTGSNIVF